jgi:hypothetical protein
MGYTWWGGHRDHNISGIQNPANDDDDFCHRRGCSSFMSFFFSLPFICCVYDENIICTIIGLTDSLS